MNHGVRYPNDPIDNLAIGRIIEVDGSHIVAELDDNVIELSRVHGGETYPIGNPLDCKNPFRSSHRLRFRWSASHESRV